MRVPTFLFKNASCKLLVNAELGRSRWYAITLFGVCCFERVRIQLASKALVSLYVADEQVFVPSLP